MQFNSHLTRLVGRFFVSVIFLMSGFQKLTAYSGTVEKIAAQGIPLATLAAAGAILFELAGGLSVLTGYKSQLGSVLLILFIIPATLFFHDFWNFPADQVQGQMIHFLKNLSILGGLLVLTVADPGECNLGS
jgi:putative oxidoreductase